VGLLPVKVIGNSGLGMFIGRSLVGAHRFSPFSLSAFPNGQCPFVKETMSAGRETSVRKPFGCREK
jgi:hypothetical protein